LIWFKAAHALREHHACMDKQGKVWLVGAGPGAAELLTLKAARLLAGAKLVLYDCLVGDGVLDLIAAGARRVYVGKQDGNHTLPQDEINELLVRLAREGNDVVRLKGGDPYVFGRGGEEALALAQAGVDFEVVPGITAAQGMAAYAGIPLTHREHASGVVFATAHGRDAASQPDWAALARPRQTVVFYMGVGSLARTCREMVAHGLRSDTPAAVVEQVTLPQQRVVQGTLLTLPALAVAQGVRAPALVVVGEVVRLNRALGWYLRAGREQKQTGSSRAVAGS
jgi:uroporphyrin-III C-methyltransferase